MNYKYLGLNKIISLVYKVIVVKNFFDYIYFVEIWYGWFLGKMWYVLGDLNRSIVILKNNNDKLIN